MFGFNVSFARANLCETHRHWSFHYFFFSPPRHTPAFKPSTFLIFFSILPVSPSARLSRVSPSLLAAFDKRILNNSSQLAASRWDRCSAGRPPRLASTGHELERHQPPPARLHFPSDGHGARKAINESKSAVLLHRYYYIFFIPSYLLYSSLCVTEDASNWSQKKIDMERAAPFMSFTPSCSGKCLKQRLVKSCANSMGYFFLSFLLLDNHCQSWQGLFHILIAGGGFWICWWLLASDQMFKGEQKPLGCITKWNSKTAWTGYM